MSESTGDETVLPAINADLAAELVVEGERWPVFVWTIDHPAGRVLVDTGMIDVRPEVDDMSPTTHPETSRAISPASSIPTCISTTAVTTASSGRADPRPGTRTRRRAFARRLHDPRVGRLRRRDVCRARGRGGATGNPPAAGARPHRGASGGRRRDRRRQKRSRRRRGHLVQRARQRHDRGTAARARASRSDLAHARGRGPESSQPN
jgi:hypothetical protein